MERNRESIQREINKANQRILELKNFLASKDYVAIRESEGGEPMSAELKQQRVEARAEINDLQAHIEADVVALNECEEETSSVGGICEL